jgi:quinol monooxygenase YgiN
VVDANDPTKAMLYEVYADEAAFEAHQQTPHFKHYLANALQYLESRERTFYRRAAP